MIRRWGLILACVGVANAARASWSPGEVSVLLPLPAPNEISSMLSPQSPGRGGDLIPKELRDQMPELAIGRDPQQTINEELKVVGWRLDPCFQEGPAPHACRRQLRLVWQPLIEYHGATLTLDAAAHSFHEFDEAGWKALLRDWPRDPGAPLGVEPQLLREGFAGARWAEWQRVILKHAGAQNLTRVTFMQVNPFGTMWAFSGVDWVGGHARNIVIAGTGSRIQTFLQTLGNLREFDALVRPFPENQVDWLNFLKNSPKASREMTEEQLRSVMRKALTLENPRLSNPGTADCVSCHVAHNVHFWGERNLSSATFWEPLRESFYTNDVLRDPSVGTGLSNRLRAFGYFRDEPQFSRRVIHETQEVVSTLNQTAVKKEF